MAWKCRYPGQGTQTFTHRVVVEVWFTSVAGHAIKRGSTVTLACLLITRHAV